MSNQSSSLQDLRKQWHARWAAMAPRERQMAIIAAWLLALVLLVFIGVRPAWKTLSQAPAQLRELDGQLDQMRRLAEESQMLRQRPPVPAVQAEAALKSATERLGAAAKMNVQGERVTLTLTEVPGDALATWLDEARGAARAKPVEAGLMQVKPGMYSGNIVLTLGAGSGGGR